MHILLVFCLTPLQTSWVALRNGRRAIRKQRWCRAVQPVLFLENTAQWESCPSSAASTEAKLVIQSSSSVLQNNFWNQLLKMWLLGCEGTLLGGIGATITSRERWNLCCCGFLCFNLYKKVNKPSDARTFAPQQDPRSSSTCFGCWTAMLT